MINLYGYLNPIKGKCLNVIIGIRNETSVCLVNIILDNLSISIDFGYNL